MIAIPQHRLDALLSRYSMVENELGTGLATDAYVKLSREFSELGPVIETIKAYRAVTAEIADLDALSKDASNDAAQRKMAESEKLALQGHSNARHQIRLALIPKTRWTITTPSSKSRRRRRRAALFAGDLFRMLGYAAKRGWKTEVISMSKAQRPGSRSHRRNAWRGVFAR